MNQFLLQFGIDWKIFLSQLFNFVLILIVLRVFVYKPLIKVLKDRKMKIEEGLEKANEAGIRLKEVDQIAKNKLKDAEGECISMLNETDLKKKQLEIEILAKAKLKEEELLKKAENLAKTREKEMQSQLEKQAGELIRSAIAKAIDEKPDQIDDKLVNKAVSNLNEL